ncbi:hypothetical protein ANO14919_119480 [Xylariales sp. No.14919]|nr:hypothetical protein ANO14919_119480 [Xylariales sp. No.14919]
MISVVTPDWRFRFMGSPESVESVNNSHAVGSQVEQGKLDLKQIPTNMSTNEPDMISRFLTSLWLYDIVWDKNARFGGNAGLSPRRVSAISEFLVSIFALPGQGENSLDPIEVLRDQTRADWAEPEDVWLTERLDDKPGAGMANGSLSLTFSGEINAGRNLRVHRLAGAAVALEVAGPSSWTSPSISTLSPSPSTTSKDKERGREYYIGE